MTVTCGNTNLFFEAACLRIIHRAIVKDVEGMYMGSARTLFVAGFAVLCAVGCSDSVISDNEK